MKKLLLLIFTFAPSALLFAQTDCIDSTLIDEGVVCPAVFDPVCGCDGITYSNSCEAQNHHGVTSWEAGECANEVNCMDLGPYDFGLCDMPLGIALINGECQGISGCSTQIDDVDYAPYFYTEMEECLECAQLEIDECEDLTDVDFGLCDQFLGYGLINGQCTPISGCGYVAADGLDYSIAIHSSPEECAATCSDPSDCEDLANLDFGSCEMIVGFGMVDGSCQVIVGCSTVADNGIDYANAIYPSETACAAVCEDNNGCLDLSLVDFGPCAAELGIIWNGMDCVTISGCSTIGMDNYDYSAYFFDSMEDCAACKTTGLNDRSTQPLYLYPTQFNEELYLSESVDNRLTLSLYNVPGQLIFSTEISPGQRSVTVADVPAGFYVYRLSGAGYSPLSGKLLKY